MATDNPINPEDDNFIDGIRMTDEGGAEVDMLPGEEPDVEELPDGSAVVKLEGFKGQPMTRTSMSTWLKRSSASASWRRLPHVTST